MTIPVMRPWLGPEEAAAAAAAVASGWVAQGPRVAEFEEAFAATVGARSRGRCLLVYHGPAPGSRGDIGRTWRRGGRPVALVHRNRQRGPLCRRAASLR